MMTLLLSLALAAASGDGAGTAAQPAAEQPAKPPKPKKVCHKIETTGSTVPKRVCRKVQEPKVEAAAEGAGTATTGGATN